MTDLIAQLLDPYALAIVGGGTVLAVLLRNPPADVWRAIAAAGTLPRRSFSAEPLIGQIASLGRIARRHGAMALDRTIIADPDLAAAIAAIVDGAAPATVSDLVATRRHTRIERHARAVDVWTSAAEAAPAMGMIGTLIGLARMFANLTDPAAIGAAMAVALLATLYGALLANLVALPVAHRLRVAARMEALERQRLDAPLVALAERERPQGLSQAA